MATEKITEKELAEIVNEEASFLITQPELDEEENKIESLKRATIKKVVAALNKAGLCSNDDIKKMYPQLVKDIETTEEGITVYFWDDSSMEVPISSGGLAFDAVSYDENGYLHITLNGEDVVDPCHITGSAGSGFGSTLKLQNRTGSRSFAIVDTDANAYIDYTVTSVDDETGEDTGSISISWYVGENRVATETVEQGDNRFDVRRFLVSGATNTVKITAEDSYGNSRSISWTITVTSFGLTWNLTEIMNHKNEQLVVRMIPSGQGDKTLHLTLDGEEIFTTVVSSSGARTVSANIPAQNHGAHSIVAWFEANVEGSVVESQILKHSGIWTEENETSPIVAIYDPNPTVQQFGTANILYAIYSPDSETSQIKLKRGDEVISTSVVDRTIQSWPYRATGIGKENLSIVCEETVGSIELTVTELGYEIAPVTNGLIMDMDPAGHTNTESNKENFGYIDADGTNHPFLFSENFDWINGGFQLDEDGVTAFVVKRGTTITTDCSLFDNNAKANGKEFKMIFKTTNCRKYDAEIAKCVDGTIGLTMNAHSAKLGSELRETNVRYCVDEKIEMDINIESSTENKLAVIWLGGIPSRGFPYLATDNWTQNTPQKLVIGSEDCDVWVYRMKLYANSLTRHEIIDNYVADCTNPNEIVARHVRNDFYNTDGTANIESLVKKAPELFVLQIEAEKMTTSKSDEVVCNVSLSYGNGGPEMQFTARNVVMKAQGTSSLEYILAALNLDLDFSDADWVNGKGEPITGYSMRPNSIPVNYINVKLNVASSESANNVCMADEYNAYQPHITAARAEDSRVRDTVEGHQCVVFFKNTSSEAIEVGARTVQAGETIMYGRGDFNNSKKNFAVFGQDNTKWPEQCCVEIMNNNNPQCRFKSDDLTTETWDGDENTSNFEFRFPKNPTDDMKAKFQELLSWVVSTDRENPTGEELPESVKYGDVTYTHDTAEYRGAKFRAEVYDYFSVGSLEYHYLTTFRHLMPDNRAKNTFVSYEWDNSANAYRWNFNKDYDNDTLAGTDNSGGMTFTYGMEDTDSVGAAKVYNASDSTLWCNVRDCMAEELKAMYLDRESKEAWNAERIIAKWREYQNAFPESLVADDMWNKHISPYIYKSEERYINMMHGTKMHQFKEFHTYQEPYCSSKFLGSAATSDRISLRTNAPDEWSGVRPSGDVVLTPFTDIYLNVKFGNAGSAKVRAKAGVSYVLECPEDASLNDLETYIYNASTLTHVGSLAALYTKLADISSAERLQEFIIGSNEDGYSNGSLSTENGGVSLGNNKLLELIDLRGTPNLKQGLDLSKLTSLEKIYTTNSGVTGVIFAVGAPVTEAKLGSIKTLVARGLTDLEVFVVSPTELQSIWIEESPKIDTYTLVKNATNLARGRLIGVEWTADNPDLIMKLSKLAGLDEHGENSEHFVLEGKFHVSTISQEELDAIDSSFPKLDVTYEELLPSFTVTFKDKDGTIFPGTTQVIRKYGAALNPITAGLMEVPAPKLTVETIETFIGWDVSFNYILEDTVVTAVYAEKLRTYTVNWWKDQAETILLKTLDNVEVHSSVAYDGAEPSGDSGLLWMGWDNITTDVTSDLNVHAVFLSPTLPDFVASDYDYIYSDNPNDKSGYTLAEFCGIVASGKASEYFAIGDRIKMCVFSAAFKDTEIVCQIESFKHYKLADDSGNFAAVSFGMVGVMNSTQKMNATNTNAGGWPATELRKWLNETVYPALPIQWRHIIKQVYVLSSSGETVPTIISSKDHLYLRSQAEVGYNTTDVPYCNEIDTEANEVRLPLYVDLASRTKRYYNGTGSAVNWWLRSPLASNPAIFASVANNGTPLSNASASISAGVSFGFSIGKRET